jgi:hypothetical protein
LALLSFTNPSPSSSPGRRLGWWTLHQHSYQLGPWLRREVPKIAAMSFVALGVFSLWYWLDPQRHLILQDFVLKENVGKFDTGGGNYFLNLLWGESSIWRNVDFLPVQRRTPRPGSRCALRHHLVAAARTDQ